MLDLKHLSFPPKVVIAQNATRISFRCTSFPVFIFHFSDIYPQSMQIQLLVPSQNKKNCSVEVSNDEKVSNFRKIPTNVLNLPASSFLLIASGKIVRFGMCWISTRTNQADRC